MALNYPSQGEFNSAAYTISATPFVTSSTVSLGQTKEIDFGYVSKFIVIRNTAAAGSTNVISVGFTSNGMKTAASNFFRLGASESFSGDFRVSKLFISGSVGSSTDFSVVSGLTTIPSMNALPITGSNGFPGVG
jgi:hypothetical protein